MFLAFFVVPFAIDVPTKFDSIRWLHFHGRIHRTVQIDPKMADFHSVTVWFLVRMVFPSLYVPGDGLATSSGWGRGLVRATLSEYGSSVRSMPSASSLCSSKVSRSGLILEWDAFLVTATLPPRSESHGGATDAPASSAEELRGLLGVLGILAGRGGAGPVAHRVTGLLGWERVSECVGERVGEGDEGTESGGWQTPLASLSLDFLAGTGGGTGGFLA